MTMHFGCSKENDFDMENTRFLTLADIKREYAIADSLNRIEDRNNLDKETKTIGVDKQNGQIIIRTCGTRGFGCLMFTDYYTLLYLNSDSVNCARNGGFWLVDYVGITGARSVVGCAPDSLKETITIDCGCTN